MRIAHRSFTTRFGALPLPLALSLLVGLAPSVQGCSSGNGSSAANDAGNDASAASDAGTGASDGAACTKHVPGGFTQAVVSQAASDVLKGASDQRSQSMVLDENDDPLIAYSTADASGSYSINFVRWDPCAGAFTAPQVVDTMHSGATPEVSLAYDPSTKEIGIAYVRNDTDNDWADGFTEIWLATRKAPAATFGLQQLTAGSTDFNSTGSPSIAMGGGHIYVAFWDGPYSNTGVDHSVSLFLFLSSTSTPGPEGADIAPFAAPDSGPVDAALPADPEAGTGGPDGGAPPHYFAYTAILAAGDGRGEPGFVQPSRGPASISVALDSTGAPGVAMFEDDSDTVSYGIRLLFWRPGTPSAAPLFSFAVNDETDLTLSFVGTKALVAGHMDTPATDALDRLALAQSDDGVTWSAPVHLPNDSASLATAFTSALAADGAGDIAVASDINSRVGNGMVCGDNPYVATANETDAGIGAWTECGADADDVHGYGSYSISLAFGASRIPGKLVSSFVSGGTDADAGVDAPGVVFWQHP